MIPFYYILSPSHSGSTLLALLLGSHPDVATAGEVSAVRNPGNGADSLLCSCREPLDKCAFWGDVRERLQRRGLSFEGSRFGTQFRMPGHRCADRLLRAEYGNPVFEGIRDVLLACNGAWRKARRDIAASIVALAEEIMSSCGGRVFLDSSKEPHHLKHLLRIPALGVRVIHLIRDGRGVAASYMRRDHWPMMRAADEWRRSILSEEYVLRRLGTDDKVQVKYEALCSDVEGVVRQLLTFMGLRPEHWERDFRRRQQHILGNRMRVGTSSVVQLDESWRQSLSPEDLRVFERVAGAINRRYGYQ